MFLSKLLVRPVELLPALYHILDDRLSRIGIGLLDVTYFKKIAPIAHFTDGLFELVDLRLSVLNRVIELVDSVFKL